MMLRVLFCISCCSPPPSNRPKRRINSNQNSKQDLRERKVSQDSKNANAVVKGRDQSLANQIETNNGDFGSKDSNAQQGKLILPLGEKQIDQEDQFLDESDSMTASTSIKLQRAGAIDFSDLNAADIEQLEALGAEFRSYDDGSVSPPSSIDVGPFTEANANSRVVHDSSQTLQAVDAVASEPAFYQQQVSDADYGLAQTSSTASKTPDQQYEPLAASRRPNVPSTTKIGDYARIEYSPIEDLDSMTTMSYSRFGSEKGGSRSQAGSTLSRQNSLGKANFNDGSTSRRSSHGGIESTSISIASQLSNEQFQQNLTNMLESVNSNYPTLGTIGLPLGPLESTMTETTKTSPETPGAALTSASQDSLSDVAFDEISPMSSRPGTLRSNRSVGAALVRNESLERGNTNTEEMAELAQPAPLASGEEEDGQQSYPSMSSQRLGSERVDTPQSVMTTTSGGLTNPTPTPSEMSGGSGKKKKNKAKSLFKKLKPGAKKSKNDVN